MHKIFLKILFILIMIIIFATILQSTVAKAPYELDSELVTKMNIIELHYDADGPFVIIDQTHNLIGYYNTTTPIYHTKWECEYKLNDGIYTLYNMDDNLLALENSNGITVYHWALTESECKILKEICNCPVLVLTDWIMNYI